MVGRIGLVGGQVLGSFCSALLLPCRVCRARGSIQSQGEVPERNRDSAYHPHISLSRQTVSPFSTEAR